MSKRNKIIIIIIVAVVIMLLIIISLLFWFNRSSISGEGIIDPSEINVPGILPSASAGLSSADKSLVDEPKLDATLKAIAFTFAERFGSYSGQENFSNLDDLRDLMTIKMKAWTDNYKVTQKNLTIDDAPYYGMTTQALNAEITSFEESLGRAEIMVTTQRQEARGNTANPQVFYQNIKLQLVKTGEGWKVDVAQWNPR